MHPSKKLAFSSFNNQTVLSHFNGSTQAKYIQQYLEYLGAKTVIVESNYFDKDYLDEFSHFYSKSARGYQNICERWHFFDFDFDRTFFEKAVGQQVSELEKIKDGYLGFCVKRPIGISPFGHTVLSQFKNQSSGLPRIVCSRRYTVHLTGLELNVEGLSWQQQDTAVGACATISIWTALHSSSFDEHHAIPTTAKITLSAHKTASLGSRIFPSNGLSVQQTCEAIKELGLSPMLLSGDRSDETFTKERFLASCCSLISSGYPVIVLGKAGGSYHAVCFTGFKPSPGLIPGPNQILLEDVSTDVFYMHDDNVGPYVRLKVDPAAPNMILRPEISPSATPQYNEVVTNYGDFLPIHILAAVHDELRTSIDTFNIMALNNSQSILNLINAALGSKNMSLVGLKVGAKFKTKVSYIQDEMDRIFNGNHTLLSKTRLALWEDVSPMSYFIGVIRLQMASQLFCDLLVDTTDNIHSNSVFTAVCYSLDAFLILDYLKSNNYLDLGELIQAY